MRTVTALLLLLMLPGLLLPPGALLHVCLCAPLASNDVGHACCAEPAHEHQSCCADHGAPVGPADRDVPHVRGDGCGCWVQVPDDVQPAKPTPPDDFAALAPPPDMAPAFTMPLPRDHLVRRQIAPDNRPPPPHRQRNLPLRL